MKQRTLKHRKVDKENILINNIVKSSRQNSKESTRKKVYDMSNANTDGNTNTSNNAKTGRNVRVGNGRYQGFQNHAYQEDDDNWDNNDCQKLELPTFGDWKNNIRIMRHSRNNTLRLNSIQLSTKPITMVTQQTLQSKPSIRLQQYQSIKLKPQLTQQPQKPKLLSLAPLTPLMPLQTIQPPACNLSIPIPIPNAAQPRRRSLVQESLSSRARALSHELQTNYETIDTNLNKIINRKQIFKNLYIKQKSKYEDLLKKYGIEEQVDDSQFQDYFKS